MDEWVRVLHPFNSISVISRRWKGEHERLCAMKCCLGSGRILPPVGFKPATPWSEVRSANRSPTRTLLLEEEDNFFLFLQKLSNYVSSDECQTFCIDTDLILYQKVLLVCRAILKKLFVCCIPTYPTFNPPTQNFFWQFWKIIFFCPIFIRKSRFSCYAAM